MADTSNSTCALRTNSDGRRVVVLYEIHRLNPHNLTVYICTVGEAGYNGNTTISELYTCKKVTAMQTGKREQYERVCCVYQCLLYKAIEDESAKML